MHKGSFVFSQLVHLLNRNRFNRIVAKYGGDKLPKGGIRMHTQYDIKDQIPVFVHITEAKAHDSKTIPEIPYENGSHYIFNRGYSDFSYLYTINRIGAFFVVRAKTNVWFNPIT